MSVPQPPSHRWGKAIKLSSKSLSAMTCPSLDIDGECGVLKDWENCQEPSQLTLRPGPTGENTTKRRQSSVISIEGSELFLT